MHKKHLVWIIPVSIVLLAVSGVCIWGACRGIFCKIQMPRWRKWLRSLHPSPARSSVHIISLATPNYDVLAQYAVSSFARYAQQHGYSLEVYRDLLVTKGCRGPNIKNGACPPHFSKIAMTIDAMLKWRGRCEYLVMTDSDAMVMDDRVTVDDIVSTSTQPTAAMHLSRDTLSINSIHMCNPETMFNTGFIVYDMRRTDVLLPMLHQWLSIAVEGDYYFKKKYYDQGAFQEMVDRGRIDPSVGELPAALYGTNISLVWRQAYGPGRSTIETKVEHFEGMWRKIGAPPIVSLPKRGIVRVV